MNTRNSFKVFLLTLALIMTSLSPQSVDASPDQISPTYWYPYVASHSEDRDNYPFSSYDYTDVLFIHVTGY